MRRQRDTRRRKRGRERGPRRKKGGDRRSKGSDTRRGKTEGSRRRSRRRDTRDTRRNPRLRPRGPHVVARMHTAGAHQRKRRTGDTHDLSKGTKHTTPALGRAWDRILGITNVQTTGCKGTGHRMTTNNKIMFNQYHENGTQRIKVSLTLTYQNN